MKCMVFSLLVSAMDTMSRYVNLVCRKQTSFLVLGSVVWLATEGSCARVRELVKDRSVMLEARPRPRASI